MSARGRGGFPGRGGRGGGLAPGRVKIGGVELNWDLTGLEIARKPGDRFPKKPPPQAPPATGDEKAVVQHHIALRDQIHEGPFYTILNDGVKSGLKRKATDTAPSRASLFNPFTDVETYSSKYQKVRRRIPKLDNRPYTTQLFPKELHSLLGENTSFTNGNQAVKKRKILTVNTGSAMSKLDRIVASEVARVAAGEGGYEDFDEDAEDEEDKEEEGDASKPDQIDDDDNWSKVSSDSEESGDDYNAEGYFDNGEDDDVEENDPYEGTYD